MKGANNVCGWENIYSNDNTINTINTIYTRFASSYGSGKKYKQCCGK